MQALHLLALEPVAETLADPHSYGFRPRRSIQDAHGQCYVVLAKSYAPEWVFDADIEACFDRISHTWLLANVPMDRGLLSSWLKAGHVEDGAWFSTEKGTPQGGIISPVLANLALDGLEAHVKAAAPRQRWPEVGRPKVHLIRYADDLIATAKTRNMLEGQIIPAIEAFLKERGLQLSEEKSRIVHISEGFDFLGANVRKYRVKLLMKPTKANKIAIVRALKAYLGRSKGTSAEPLIHQVNRRLRGWANAFRHLVSYKDFQHVDRCLIGQLWRWARRRHGNKGRRWVWRRYYRRRSGGSWRFTSCRRDNQGRLRIATLFLAGDLRIRRHVKIQANAKLFNPLWEAYFEERRKLQRNARQRDFYRWQEDRPLELPWPA